MERKTSQRQAIKDAIRDADRPLTPGEVLKAARGAVPSMGMATVYRALKSFTEEGWLEPVEIPGEPPRYEVAGKPHHHHFYCRTCERVYEVQGCPGNLKAIAPEGFRLEGHEVLLYGLCEPCARIKSPAA